MTTTHPHCPTPASVVTAAHEISGYQPWDLISSRAHPHVFWRDLILHYLHSCRMTYAEIGRHFDKMDPSSVCLACQRVKKRLAAEHHDATVAAAALAGRVMVGISENAGGMARGLAAQDSESPTNING